MKNTYLHCLLVVFTSLLYSCSFQETESPLSAGEFVAKTMSFTASTPGFMGEMDTKTELDPNGAGKKILWSAHDQISIFYGPSGVNNVFTSENTEPVSSATFTGGITAFTGSNESGVAHSFWGIYPYSEDNTCDGESVTAAVKSSLKGYPNDIERGSLVTVAKSYGLNLSFKNACSGFKLSFNTDGITKVVVKSNSGASIAGTMTVDMDSDGLPELLGVSGGSDTIELDLSDNPSEVGKYYYIPMIPGTLTGGFTIELYKGPQVGTYTTSQNVPFTRSNWVSFANVDNYVTWETVLANNVILYTSTDGEIVTPFAKNVFGANIVSNEYINGQGVITFDGDVSDVGTYAFKNCGTLSSVVIPGSAGSIAIKAGNRGTRSDEEVSSIGNYAFYGCSNLVSVTIPDTVTTIGESAFEGCSSLESINIPDGVTVFDYYVFAGCSKLAISIPEQITTIKDRAFRGCIMPNVVIPASVTDLVFSLWSPFDGVAIETITVEEGNQKYDSRDGCNAIIETATNTLIVGSNSTVIPPTVKTIGMNSFGSTSTLSSMEIPFGVESIKNKAFSGCQQLRFVSFPASLQSVGEYAFNSCPSLRTIVCEAVVPPSLGSQAISQNSQLKVYVPFFCDNAYSGSSQWSSFSINEIYSANDQQIETVGFINLDASIVRLRLLNSDLSISDVRRLEYFAGCDYYAWELMKGKLRYLDMRLSTLKGSQYDEDDSYTSDYGYVAPAPNVFTAGIFRMCNQLNTIILPTSITSISQGAFRDCKNLSTVYIYGNVSSISNSFAGCTNLKHIYCDRQTPPTLDASTASYIPGSCIIHVPSSAVSAYQGATNWGSFTIVAM